MSVRIRWGTPVREAFGLALWLGLVVAARADTQLGRYAFGYTGGDQTLTVPSGTNYLIAKVWGAGGGGGHGCVGGGGGFISMLFTASPGAVLTVRVGGGGHANSNTGPYAYPDGGRSLQSGGGNAGGGGGRSEVAASGIILVAGGGGGGGCGFDAYWWGGGSGGAGGSTGQGGGGGASGETGGGGGASQTAGGAGGSSAHFTNGSSGVFHQGGDGGFDTGAGGGGGGGYYGGGGGGGAGYNDDNDSAAAGGGGGSSFASGGSLLSCLDGSGTTPGATGDSDYPNDGTGYGGTSSGAGTDGASGYVVIYAYQANVPVITSSTATITPKLGQSVSYTITGTFSPTSYGASGLPPGISVNASTGVISGAPTSGGTYNSSIQATNANGTGSATLPWAVSVISPNASVSPSSLYLSQSMTLYRDGTTNFGMAWTENVIWHPDGSSERLPNAGWGSSSYTPAAGTGTYWYQFRLVDAHNNFQDQWISFTVTSPSVTAPTSVSASTVGSTYILLNWSGATAQAGIAHYNVYRNGVFVGTTTTASDPDNTVLPGVTYTYQIQTVDTQGNISGLSSAYTVTAAPSFDVFTPLP